MIYIQWSVIHSIKYFKHVAFFGMPEELMEMILQRLAKSGKVNVDYDYYIVCII